MLFTGVKIVGQIVIGVGSGTLVRGLVNTVTPGNVSKLAKGCAYATGMVVSAMTADKVSDYFSNQVDNTEEAFNRIKEEVKNKKR